ncbi:MAG: aminotransferase class I/II-fold pyridoxal phosphate-dependent enzyme [Clostridia bacterium]|nr:aminotransferase class I/II-fold pyridoxal phosphate-dependent enzyme [Clostridia bacterium]
MKTPIYDFVRQYADSAAIRMHMPGHKGRGENSPYDITEIPGADSLYLADGIILESEKNAGRLFGADTFYSTEGSSLSIRAAMLLVCELAIKKGSAPKVLAARNVHKSFITAAALLDFEIEWIESSSNSYLSSGVTAAAVEKALSEAMHKPTAVYITSPDYLGFAVDVRGIAAVCKKHGVLLVVDNAHGAYLKFLERSQHPIDLGADIVCDSAHKTLPTLTGGAYLHISKNADKDLAQNARTALATFGSTSPSYLILASLDRTNEVLAYGYREKLKATLAKINKLKDSLTALGYLLYENEPMKIAISAKEYGYTGDKIAEHLEKSNIICEFFDRDYVVLMPSVSTTEKELDTLYSALKALPKKSAIKEEAPAPVSPLRVMTPREAMMSAGEKIAAKRSLGRVLRTVTVGCPPAVPIVVSGEIITKEAIAAFEYYGIEEIDVVKR